MKNAALIVANRIKHFAWRSILATTFSALLSYDKSIVATATLNSRNCKELQVSWREFPFLNFSGLGSFVFSLVLTGVVNFRWARPCFWRCMRFVCFELFVLRPKWNYDSWISNYLMQRRNMGGMHRQKQGRAQRKLDSTPGGNLLIEN